MRDIGVVDAGYWQGGASGRNGTLVRPGFSSPEWTRLFGHSHQLWLGLSRRLGHNVMMSRPGYVVLAESQRTASICEQVGRGKREKGLRRPPCSTAETPPPRRGPEPCPLKNAPRLAPGGNP